MTDISDRTVLLSALSERQRRAVQRHMPLVHLTLKRMHVVPLRRRCGRERRELIQEGALALVEAYRGYDALRHGDFPAYAMARVHYAISRFVHEAGRSVRVPFMTQRRRQWRKEAEGDRHRPDNAPRVICRAHPARGKSRVRRPMQEGPRDHLEGPTVGELLRDRYDAAVTRVVRKMRRVPSCHPDTAKLLRRCHAERWIIPDPEYQTPIRQLAREMNCSLGRVTHCEARFRRHVAEALTNDTRFQDLLRQARSDPDGWRHRPKNHNESPRMERSLGNSRSD